MEDGFGLLSRKQTVDQPMAAGIPMDVRRAGGQAVCGIQIEAHVNLLWRLELGNQARGACSGRFFTP